MNQRESSATQLLRLKVNAQRAWARGAFAQARQDLLAVLALAPKDAEGAKMMAIVEQRLGNHRQATVHFRQALSVLPYDVAIRTGLAISLSELGAADEAICQFQEASRLQPRSAHVWSNLGEAMARQNRFDEAEGALHQAIILDPRCIPAHLALARIHAIKGDMECAIAEFRAVLDSHPGNAEAWFGLSYLNTPCLGAEDVARLRQILTNTRCPTVQKEKLTFALAKALEATRNYDEAFEAFTTANELGKQRVQWKHSAQHARNLAIEKTFATANPATAPTLQAGEMIFIASLPRSGSTLVEAILAAHPDVEGGNETRLLAQILDGESHRRGQPFPGWVSALTDADWSRLGRDYMEHANDLRTDKARFVDKSLLNWQLAGAALSALPNARVVIVQRDAVETCLACYRQCLGPESGFACDLDWLADQYADFVRLTRLWLKKYPQRVFHLGYEDLVQHPEDAIRELLAFCGLPFNRHCLTYYETRRPVKSLPSTLQVRQPLQSNTAKAHLYGDHLEGLRKRLQRPQQER